MFIRTERLFLRPGWPEDIDDLLEAFRDEALQLNAPLLSPLPRTREEAREYLSQPRDRHMPKFFMYLRGAYGARLVGFISLEPCDGDVELHYWIATAFRGRGYALEAVRAVVEQARTLGHYRLVAKHFVDNVASIRVLEAAGFEDTGSECLRYSAGRGGEALARLYVANLERRSAPRIESSGEALSA